MSERGQEVFPHWLEVVSPGSWKASSWADSRSQETDTRTETLSVMIHPSGYSLQLVPLEIRAGFCDSQCDPAPAASASPGELPHRPAEPE